MNNSVTTNHADETTPLLEKTRDSAIFEETDEDNRRRWRSIRVMYLTMFVASLGFSIVVTSIWPYLQSIAPTKDTTFLGWLVAAFSLGQLVASPLFGLCSNYVTPKWPVAFTLVIGIFANILYGYVAAFHTNNGVIMMVSRVFVGISAGNNAVARSYVSAATTLTERTPAMANLSAAQALGFILGPVIQTAFTPIGETGIRLDAIKLTLNMYTVPAFMNALLGILNLILLLAVFKPYIVPDTGDCHDRDLELAEEVEGSVDKLAVIACIVVFFVILFVFSLNETIGVPLAMDMYAWTRKQAVLYTGFILGSGSIIAMVMFMVLKPLSKRFDERNLLLVGVFLMLIGFVLDIPMPWSSDYPPRPIYNLNVTNNSYELTTSHSEAVGCAWNVGWCNYTHKIYLAQYLVGASFLAAGYPIATVMSMTIYSKILGPKPQGLFMGFLTGAGSLARTVGPIFVSQFYAKLGPKWTFLTVSIILMLTLISIVITYTRLIPFIDRHKQIRGLSIQQ
ncbi:major facilitator superfamily domain-containing protein 8-like [Glandiceps talaboti]